MRYYYYLIDAGNENQKIGFKSLESALQKMNYLRRLSSWTYVLLCVYKNDIFIGSHSWQVANKLLEKQMMESKPNWKKEGF